jgi:hypothetical protein
MKVLSSLGFGLRPAPVSWTSCLTYGHGELKLDDI